MSDIDNYKATVLCWVFAVAKVSVFFVVDIESQ